MLRHMFKSPYGSFRKGQLESIDFIKSNLGSFIALKAPTGFGKTLVAILSHLNVGRTFYAVRTRNELAPVIRELRAVGTRFTIVFSGRRMCPLVKGYEIPSEDFWLNCRILRLKGLCNYFNNLSKYSSKYVLKLLMNSKDEDPHTLVKSIITKFSVCPFFTLTSLTNEVEFVLATYPYLFRDDVYATAFTDVSLSEFYVIVDEAHNLLNPQMIISASIDLKTVKSAYDYVVKLSYTDLVEYLSDLIRILEEVRSDKFKRIDKEFVLDEGIIQRISDVLLELKLRALMNLNNESEAFIKASSPLSKLVKFLYILSKEGVNAYGILREDRELHALPASYDVILERLGIAKGVLLMSGTLPDERLMNFVVGRNVKYLNVVKEFGPIFPEGNSYYVVYTALTTSYLRRSEKMFMEYARLVETIYNVRNGVVLAVYPSYEVLNDVVTYIRDASPITNENVNTTLEEVLNIVVDSGKLLINAVAGGKLVEGIELRSSDGRSLIDTVILCGVPYPQPDDYLRDLRNTIASHTNEEVAKEIALDVQAGIKVIQAIGRAMRSETDRVFVVLADRRYLSSSLKEVLGIRYNYVTSKLEDVIEVLKKFHLRK